MSNTNKIKLFQYGEKEINYLKSKDLTNHYPPQSLEENSTQILYSASFDIEKDALKR